MRSVVGAGAESIDYTRGVHRNGENWDPNGYHGIPMGMGVRSAMGWEWELSAWEWELRRGSCHQQL